jgi:membrane protease YdiL (CAAX protease family)
MVTGLALMPLGTIVTVLAMGVPTAGVLLMLLVVTRDGYTRAGWAELGLHHAGLRAWPLAIFVPFVVIGVSYGIVWATGIAQLSPPDLDAAGWTIGLGRGVFENLVIATLTFSLLEELGWRGYLLPLLARGLGAGRGMAATGVLHGLFHLPVILLTPFYHPDGNRWVLVPLFLTAFTVGGLLYGYLRLSTDSVWPASLAHSAHNYSWNLFTGLTIAGSPIAAEYLAGEAGILPILGYGLAAAILLPRLRWPRPDGADAARAVPHGSTVSQPAAMTSAPRPPQQKSAPVPASSVSLPASPNRSSSPD